MNDEKIVLIGMKPNDLDKCIDEYSAGLNCRCAHYKIDGNQFCLICNVEMTRIVLYVRRDYVHRNGKLCYVDLHAIKSYQSYNDCLDNLNGDLMFFAKEEPEEVVL